MINLTTQLIGERYMSVVTVNLSIDETTTLLAYIEELENSSGMGGSYPSIYTTVKERLQEAQTNEEKLTK